MRTRDRYGEVIEDDGVSTAEPLLHDTRCTAGWLSAPTDDIARPCLTCRPHLADRDAAPRRHPQGAPR